MSHQHFMGTGSVIGKILTCLLFLMAALPAAAECLSAHKETFYVSGRYTDAAEYGSYLVLSSGYGLTFKDRDLPNTADLHTAQVPGEINALVTANGYLYAVARDSGIFSYYSADPGSDPIHFPSQNYFFPIENLISAAIYENALFSNEGDRIRHFGLNGAEKPQERDQWNIQVSQVVATSQAVFALTNNGEIYYRLYSENGFTGASRKLTVLDQSAFFGMRAAGDRILVDSIEGISIAGVSQTGEVTDAGRLYQTGGAELILNWTASEDFLFLRFSDRLEAISTQLASPTASANRSVSMPFSEIGTTRLRAVGDRVYFINAGPGGPEWSLNVYEVEDTWIQARATLEPSFDDVTGVAMVKGHLFLASNQKLFHGGMAEQFGQGALSEIRKYGAPIQELSGDGKNLYLTTAGDDPSTTLLHGFEVDENGALGPAFTRSMTGSLRQLDQSGDHLLLVQYLRDRAGDHYTLHLFQSDDASAASRTFERITLFDRGNPFRDLQITDMGLLYHDGEEISLHQNVARLEELATLQLPIDEAIVALVATQNHIWVETESGLYVVRLENLQPNVVGYYPNWVDLRQLDGNHIMARNRQDPVPSRYHALYLEDRDLLEARNSVSTSSPPIFSTWLSDSLFVVERSALQNYRVECQPARQTYLLPFIEDAELEISTALGDFDQIHFIVFNVDGQAIGTQHMDVAQIAHFNGRPLADWLVDYNHLEAPFTVLLSSSSPVAPVISGQATEHRNSRFAYQVPESELTGSETYLPHVPKNDNQWATKLYLHNFVQTDLLAEDKDVAVSQVLEMTVENSSGEGRDHSMLSGSTETLTLQAQTFETPTSWAKISSADLTTRLGGFGMFSESSQTQAAAVPLIANLSDVLVVPYLAGRQRPSWWTGIVLANPHSRPVNARIVGYGVDGQIVRNQTVPIPAKDSLVEIAESWSERLKQGKTGPEVQWIAIASEKPIMGMLMYGDLNNNSLAGLPLRSSTGSELLFSGVRSDVDWWTSLVITNAHTVATDVSVEALNGQGQTIATSYYNLESKEHLDGSVRQFFPELKPSLRESIQTIRVHSYPSYLSGFMFRGLGGTESLEAASALHLIR
ncbi:hypothetical protein SCOR_31355 [Sulfidibacter corallicola]|uniref:ELWxxDGT repeat-containing protein n=1 Tax=Sulfidibacter corallicola TaxID=2818388 RepID=A0A8A4TM58_SULCO|nr:hypothetical protein [Sulfidibacter corallicola]QTD49951.1 hypothetical protein J3U87_30585 [Sulfidibacter corallicola]